MPWVLQRPSGLAFAISALLGSGAPLAAQFPPRELKNVQVLPESISVRGLINVMRGFSFGLGVRCEYCHVGEAGKDLATFDFVSDDKATKKKARVMLEMVKAINADYLAKLPHAEGDHDGAHLTVGCETCHRGQPVPYTLEQKLRTVVDAKGADSAVATYRALRQEYYGSAAYDFSEFRLADLGGELIQAGKVDAAIKLFTLNLEFFPRSVSSIVGLGDAYAAQGDKDKAATHYRWALVLDPGNRFVQGKLQRLTQP